MFIGDRPLNLTSILLIFQHFPCFTVDYELYWHIYTGVEKEKIRVEVEDSRYLIIRTEGGNNVDDESTPAATRSFMRKFRLPGMVDVDGISAGYRDGVLTVTVPRSFVRGRLLIHPTHVLDSLSFGASAA
nr:15.4 kDa class V heat shock protein [Ipomoea batatas]